MLSDIASLISSDNSILLHWIIFISLILGGFGLPIPEDLPLIVAGVVAANGAVPLISISIVCYLGVLLADLLIYGVGYRFGPKLLDYGTRSPFLPSVTPERMERVRNGLRRRRFLYIFLGRHLFPLRSVTFLTAGALRIPFLEFLISDLIAALISVTLMIGLGYILGETITPEILEKLGKDIHLYGVIATMIVVCAFSVRYWHKRKKRRGLSDSKETGTVRHNKQDQESV
ncbi:MAG TPA: DedA family protein [Oligoflexia bacterium]|nr:DedA family protein [Oligoflexia bacterium]HMP47492.1 DedA family protein [Oligoflexia bacterium]